MEIITKPIPNNRYPYVGQYIKDKNKADFHVTGQKRTSLLVKLL